VAEPHEVHHRAASSAAGKLAIQFPDTAYDTIVSARVGAYRNCETAPIKKSRTSGLF